ncbi:hypothetical protein TSUD_147910 [Trifolium subterraneum]|uniref:Transposase (putative) gypsy type domain-containing protein n=1 Tax=Trifolium subterraneum TaxID=3900 RepID=A0A2Z6P629_TRISU|nr:hypothetical protein TSUD_147910 [Trifolium subterraneum]
MVILRKLDGAKDYPLVIHPVGSDWERQVRAHYTRADGTLNINGYYFEMFVFTVKSSDFESGTSDSDSDSSGNDSDCVIISPSEFGSKNHNNRYLIVADSIATISTSMEISSRFTTDEFVSTFRQAVQVSGEGGENRVAIVPVVVGKFMTTVNEQEPHYFYMYIHVLQTLNLWLTFNSFECQILRVMNVTPCQLHPNSWAFLKAFQIACEWLDVVPTAGIFFCFFHVKNVSPHSLVSISSQPNKERFSLYASKFKNYRDTFVRFRCREGFPELIFDASGDRLLPFYWSSVPRLIKGTRVDTLIEYERQAVAAFSRFHVMSSGELIARESKPNSLGEYMSYMSTLLAQQRAALVLKARAQRAEAERTAASANAMAQLDGSNTMAKDKLTCCPSNPELKKGKKSNLSASLWTKDFDSFSVVNESFQKYARTSSLSDHDFEDLRQAAMDHHIQGAILSYYLSTHQEHDTIEAMNKMESAENGLSALEKEYAVVKGKFEQDLAAAKAGQEEAVKVTVKAKDDEVIALKGKVKALECELDVETQGKEEASQKVDTLTAKVDALEMDVASQYDDGFRFSQDQVKVAFPDVDAVKLGELDSVNQIVDGKIVAYVRPAFE